MDEKMSDKKEWREWQLRVGEMQAYVYAGDELDPKKDDYIEAIEKAAFETEKQRADSLQEKLDDEADLLVKTHNKLMEQRQRADRLEKENQKLKEALENAMGSIYFTDTELWNELKEALK